MAYAQAKKVNADVIPVIDITPLRDNSDATGVARALHKASQELGFIYIKGHGIDPQIIENARASAHEFFNSPLSVKSSVSVSPKHRGWLASGGAKMENDAKSDLKESFIWGYEDSNGDTPQDHSLRGPNQWPKQLPAMQKHAMAYFHRAQEVAHHLMQGFALGLDLERNFFLQTCSQPISRASYVYYPQQPENLGSNQFGVGPHTDFGVLTVLCQDDVGGLQVEDINGEWIEAPPIADTLIVNVADLLSRWTDGAYKSTPHRVINSSGRKRLSLVLAFDPDPDTIIDARDIFGADYLAKESPITCGDYLDWRFKKAFSYRKD